jgi:hypothetical protein
MFLKGNKCFKKTTLAWVTEELGSNPNSVDEILGFGSGMSLLVSLSLGCLL